MPARLLLIFCVVSLVAADDPTRILPPGQRPDDRRLTAEPRDLNKSYFPFTPPTNREAWDVRKQALRTQIQVALGLWPMPERGPVTATVHSPSRRDGYTVEKVFFASLPGHYVTGNLYRPAAGGRHPVVLCPHGHWADGRMHDAGERAARQQVEQGAEQYPESARYFLQAKCAQLARMGCIVFHYDMLGYADSRAIPHRQGFTDSEAILRLQSQMGLQTWNSLRSLDFVLDLPDVDPDRVGVTGASGGGTQSFILAVLDDRVTAAFPAVMVSTAMQGGCVCENAPYLRLGTGNVEIAGLFAPKPLGMTGANDWTREFETKGLPELKALYRLYDAEDQVMAKCFLQFGHNYNQISREVMYNWFNKHLKLGLPEPVREQPFVPIPPKELSVFDAAHPRPMDEVGAEGVKQYLTEQSRRQMQALTPRDAEGLAAFRRVVGGALRVLIHDTMPPLDDVQAREIEKTEQGGRTARKLLLSRKGQNEAIPAYELGGPEHDGTIVVWVHPEGKASLFSKGRLVPAAQAILDRKAAILAVDVFGIGELAIAKVVVNAQYAGFTFGYNRPILSERVRDILTAVGFAKGHPDINKVHLVGWDAAGPWVVLACALAGDMFGRTAADLNGFRFEDVKSSDDSMMLPGVLKYGGLPAFAALCAPNELLLHNCRNTGVDRLTASIYRAVGDEERLLREPERLPEVKVVEWLFQK